ncbi:MAG: SdrD B-like domain-containing protein [Chloroflexota bacterium]
MNTAHLGSSLARLTRRAVRASSVLVTAALLLSLIKPDDGVAATPPPAGTISGFVFDDANRNGIFDNGEGKLGNVGVTLLTDGRTTLTNSNGVYRFDGAAVNFTHSVRINLPTGATNTTPLQVAVTLNATVGRDDVNFGIAGAVSSSAAFVTGVVFDDTKNRNSKFDDNEVGVSGVTVALERADGTAALRTAVTDANGRYRFDSVVPQGQFLVSITVPADFEATTTRQREAVVTGSSGSVINFGIARANINSRFLVGLVFDDKDQNGIRGLNEDGRQDINLRLERVDDTESSRSTKTDGSGKYKFQDLTPGTYVLTLSVPTNSIATTSTRREISVGQKFDSVEDFGLFDATTANATATAIAATATSVSQTGILPNGDPDPNTPAGRAAAAAKAASQAAATATAVAATATANRPTSTATPSILQRVRSLAIPRTARFLLRAVEQQKLSRQGPTKRTDVIAEGVLITPDQISLKILRNEVSEEYVVLGQRAFLQSAATGGEWKDIPFAEVRKQIEVLLALDALNALRYVENAQDGGEVTVDGVKATQYTADINTLAMWEATVRRDAAPAPVAQDMKIITFVANDDRIVRSQRVAATVLLPVSDPSEIQAPIDVNATISLIDVNRPLTIVAPALPSPTAIPTAAAAAGTPGPAAAPGGAPGAAPARGTPGTGRDQLTPTPGTDIEQPEGTPGPAPAQPAPAEQAPPGQREQQQAAERALVALASGGTPRSNSIARGDSILLDVPFRTQQDGTGYMESNSGPASLSMVLASYGIEVALGDLRALVNGLESNYTTSSRPRMETLGRIAERGGLNVVDLYRGPRFNEWSVGGIREMIRRGFPVVTLVQGAVLPGGTPAGTARERFVTIIGIDGDELIYHDPAYPDEGTGAARRMSARALEQGWLAASTARLAAGFSQGQDGRGLLDAGRADEGRGTPGATPRTGASPTARIEGTVAILATIPPASTPAAPENPFGLPVHPLLIVFWLVLVLLLVAILLRSLR